MNEYRKSPDVTIERLYLDTMESVYSRSQKVLIDIESGGSNVLYLPLDRLRGGSGPARVDLDSLTYPPTTTTNSNTGSAARDDARSRGGR